MDARDSTDQRFEAYLSDLRRRVLRAARPDEAIKELGMFVEDLSRASCVATDRNPDRRDLGPKDLHARVAELIDDVAVKPTEGALSPITSCYPFRNETNHANPIRAALTDAEVRSRLDGLEVTARQWFTVERLGGRFFAAFFTEQQSSLRLAAARRLADALDHTPELLEAVWSHLGPVCEARLPVERRGFFQAPLRSRIAPALDLLAAHADLPAELDGLLLAGLEAPPILDWVRHERHLALARSSPHLPVLRLVLERVAHDRWLVDRIAAEHSGLLEHEAALGGLTGTDDLPEPQGVVILVVAAMKKLGALAHRQGLPQPIWADWVLRVQVPDASAVENFEGWHHRGSTLESTFRTVVLAPRDEWVLLRCYERPFDPAGGHGNTTVDWTSSDTESLREAAKSRTGLLVGPNGWAASAQEAGVPVAFLAYADVVATVVAPEAEESRAVVDRLFPGGAPQPLSRLLDAVHEARLTREQALKLKVIWDEPSYARGEAQPLEAVQ